MISWFCLVGIVFGLAETAKHSNVGFARGRQAIWLGEISYSLYMGHVFVDLIVMQLAQRLIKSPDQLASFVPLITLVSFIGALVFAAMLFHGVEKPARNWLRTRDPFNRKGV